MSVRCVQPGIVRQAIMVCVGMIAAANPLSAEIAVPAGKAQTNAMAGGFAVLREPGQTEPYQSSTDPSLFPSFPVWFDTGASGNLISYTIASDLQIPTPGQTYQDVGIGGAETFDISALTQVLLLPSQVQATYNDIFYADQMNNYSSYDNFKFQVRQEDKWLEEALSGYYNLIGTPVLNDYVMRVRPNSLTHQFDLSLLGGPYPMLYMETALLGALPPNLPSDRTVYVPLSYQDFVPGTPPDLRCRKSGYFGCQAG